MQPKGKTNANKRNKKINEKQTADVHVEKEWFTRREIDYEIYEYCLGGRRDLVWAREAKENAT